MIKNWNHRLKEKRIQANLTLSQVSEMNSKHLSQQSLIKYEKGEIYPQIDTLEELCQIYKTDINYIMYGSEHLNIAISKSDILITIWYLLTSNQIELIGDTLVIKNERLKKQIFCLNVFVEENGISSMQDIYRLIAGIKNMKDDV